MDVHTGPTPGAPIWRLMEDRMELGVAETEARKARRADDAMVDFIFAMLFWEDGMQD